jgi:hypothetical protein
MLLCQNLQLYQEYCKAPTAPLSTNTDQIATTAFVLANVANSAMVLLLSDIISTSSTTDVLMTGMSKSPVPGTYLVFFNSQYSIIPLRRLL